MTSGFSKNQIVVWIRNSLDDKDKKAFKDKDTIESLLTAISEKFFIRETCRQHVIAHMAKFKTASDDNTATQTLEIIKNNKEFMMSLKDFMGTKEKSGELFYTREMIYLAERHTIGEYNSREGEKYFDKKAQALPFSRLQMCHPVRGGKLAPPQRSDIRKSEDEVEAELELYLKYLEKYETRLKDCLHKEAMGKNYI